MKKVWFGAAAVVALSLSAFGAQAEQADAPYANRHLEMMFAAADAPTGGDATSLESPHYGTWGFDVSGVDRSVKPGDDFYKFANGLWDAKTEIPADRVRYGNFDKLAELSDARNRAIIEEAAAGKLTDADGVKIGAAYKAFMDEARLEALDAKPLAPFLAQLKAVNDKAAFTQLMATAPVSPFMSLFGLYISADEKDPTRYAVYAGPDGMGLPDRDYYLEAKFAEKKTAYQAYVAQMLEMAGWADPQGSAKAVVEFETQIAQLSWTRVQERDSIKMYDPKSTAELQAYAPGVDWSVLLAGAELPGVKRVVINSDTAVAKLAALYAATPIETLKDWQAFHLVDGGSPLLSKRFVDANFAFRGKVLSGQPQIRPRWKRGVTRVNSMLGEAVGRHYVAEYFPPESKAKADELVGNILAAMKLRIEKLDWMTPDTRAKALDKLAHFTVKIGYPKTWRDYSALVVKDDDAYGNAMRTSAFNWRRDVARVNGPVDRDEWGMTPQTVNAYYNPPLNEIVFPAAILQPPFFDPKADPAVNYGGIGGVIGHEISHGFDDQGRNYAGDGKLSDWWQPADAAKFEVQAKKLGDQYSAFEPLPGAKVNGGLTMGENIGDMGGLSLALDAYRISLKGKPAPVLDGFTGDQRVYLGWAQVWRGKIRDDALRQQVVTDPHSPGYYRVNGTIRNQEGWYSSFDIKPGDKLYVAPADRVKIW
jgi:putative endopeptidase